VISGGIVAPKSQLDALADAMQGLSPADPTQEDDPAAPASDPPAEHTRIAAR
jgi:hypothetical protein